MSTSNRQFRLSDEQQDLLCDMYRRGRSGAELAETFGISEATTYAILRAHEVPRRPRGKYKRPNRVHPREIDGVRKMRRAGASWEAIARQLGIGKPKARRIWEATKDG